MKKVFAALGIIGVIIIIIIGFCFSFSSKSAAIGIIGSADGPTAVFVTGNLLLSLLIVAAIILATIIAIRKFKKKK